MLATGPVVDIRHAHSAEQDLRVHMVHCSLHVVGRAGSRRRLWPRASHTHALSSMAHYLQPFVGRHCGKRRFTNLKEHSENIVLGLMRSDGVAAICCGGISEQGVVSKLIPIL